MLKELEEEKANYEKVSNAVEAQNIKEQIDVLSLYLPKLLSEQEVYDIIAGMEDKSIPSVMKKFKADYAGKCDMHMVGDVLKKFAK